MRREDEVDGNTQRGDEHRKLDEVGTKEYTVL